MTQFPNAQKSTDVNTVCQHQTWFLAKLLVFVCRNGHRRVLMICCHSCILPLSLEKEISACLYQRLLSLECPWLYHIHLKTPCLGELKHWVEIMHVWPANMALHALHALSVGIFPYSLCAAGLSILSRWVENLDQDALMWAVTLALVREESRTLWRGLLILGCGTYFLFTFLLQLKDMSVCCFSKPNHSFSSLRQGCAESSKVIHSKTQQPIGSVWQLKIQPLMP